MRAFVVTGPGKAEVQEVDPPVPRPGEVVVDVERAGVCGTDIEFFTGEMAYLHTGEASYPVRIGHEWSGVVTAAGSAADESWVGRRVTGDTMLGCGRCARCTSGRQHLCADRHEIGIRHGWPGALAAQLPVPVRALHELPGEVDATLGALVEPGGNAFRAVQAANLAPGARVLVMGPGTIGLLTASFAAATGAEVHLLGLSLAFARSLGFTNAWTAADLPSLPFDAVIDCSTAASLPARAVDLVEPGGRVVFIGIAGEPSLVDTRRLALKDLTAVGILSASGALAQTISAYAAQAVDPRPLVAATVGLDEAVAVLSGRRDPAWGDAPKVHIDPRI
ncbi:alcohol dehydrogenase catalytic domain-containing protein [Actinoplanes sp. NBRC 103695]|uniref:zinc-dependent alcohol dehydrogenase n=1 Tax=Actinoplanes sp. NBRC 103695 TaxID=3032202 RepID=UPI0024A3BB4C|nr:alcohol dehydrogenase catalytic domain-containing protein [Actinoplanes sp. NBRC 103695]GLY93004.1 alcohol dehydrogenase [Actinoplanes sp. NBRC 103695]